MTDTRPCCDDCRPYALRGPDWCSTCQIAEHAEEDADSRRRWIDEALEWKSRYELLESMKDAWVTDYDRAMQENERLKEAALVEGIRAELANNALAQATMLRERAERERDEARTWALRLRARCEETDARFYASNIARIAAFCEGVEWLKSKE